MGRHRGTGFAQGAGFAQGKAQGVGSHAQVWKMHGCRLSGSLHNSFSLEKFGRESFVESPAAPNQGMKQAACASSIRLREKKLHHSFT
eukprot:1160109-Pelagomonas_calceolata.AAC.8